MLTSKIGQGHTSLAQERLESWGERDGIRATGQVVAFLLTIAALLSRRPDMFLHAQFYAEDGHYWYAQAYNLGWARSLLQPAAGYLQTFPRLVAGVALLFSFQHAPLVMNLAGIVAQALPVTALLSARCRTWGPLPMRLLMAVVYVAIPNASEIHVVLTNAQWHLVILELLIGFGAAPQTWSGRVSDSALFLIGGVSGPFSLLIAPLTLYFWWKCRQRWTLVISAMLALGAGLELLQVLHTGRAAPAGPLGATPLLFARLIGIHVLLGGILHLGTTAARIPTPVILLCALVAALILVYGFLRGTLALRLMIVFVCLFLVTALHSPAIVAHPTEPLWQMLLVAYGCRYWFFPTLALLWSAMSLVFLEGDRFAKIGGYCVLVPLLLGIARDWRYPPVGPSDFRVYAQRLEQAKPGEHVFIPYRPEGWSMDLVKRAGSH